MQVLLVVVVTCGKDLSLATASVDVRKESSVVNCLLTLHGVLVMLCNISAPRSRACFLCLLCARTGPLLTGCGNFARPVDQVSQDENLGGDIGTSSKHAMSGRWLSIELDVVWIWMRRCPCTGAGNARDWLLYAESVYAASIARRR